MTQKKLELKLQAEFWQWAWANYPQFRKMMWSVPNDAIGQILTKKDMIQAGNMKATGMLPGVWDLHAYPPGGPLHIIETKSGINGLTADRIIDGKKVYGQKEWGELMAANGAVRHIYRTLEEGQKIYKEIVCIFE